MMFLYQLPAATGGRTASSKRLSVFRDIGRDGAPEEIRTPDPQIRSLVLYPAELRVRTALRAGPGI